MELHEAQAEIGKGLRIFKAFEKVSEVIDRAIITEQNERETRARIDALKVQVAGSVDTLAGVHEECSKLKADAAKSVAAAKAEAAEVIAKAREKADKLIAGAKAEFARAARAVSDANAELASIGAMLAERNAAVARACSEEAQVNARIDAAKAKALEAFKA